MSPASVLPAWIPPPAAQEAQSSSYSYQASSSNQPCSYCRHHTSHAYFESIDPDTDTDSDGADLGGDE
eukprot:6100487-Prorocentrum_lima.AAC.1